MVQGTPCRPAAGRTQIPELGTCGPAADRGPSSPEFGTDLLIQVIAPDGADRRAPQLARARGAGASAASLGRTPASALGTAPLVGPLSPEARPTCCGGHARTGGCADRIGRARPWRPAWGARIPVAIRCFRAALPEAERVRAALGGIRARCRKRSQRPGCTSGDVGTGPIVRSHQAPSGQEPLARDGRRAAVGISAALVLPLQWAP